VGQYLPILALTVLAILFAAVSFVLSHLIAPRRPSSAKEAPYECGIVPSRDNPERFPVSFYVVAMLFIMFDIELIFAFPYAVDSEFLGTFGFYEMVAFSAVFFVAFVYMVARGALEWGPIQKAVRPSQPLVAQNTQRESVRVVGREGRELDTTEAA
jgi:NADH-quinone oxidoreductase subunit A